MGEWDKVSIIYGYQDFPAGTDEPKALARILDEAAKKDLIYLTNQDIDAHPRVDQWSNGTDAAAELTRMMEVRRVALSRFGENAIKLGEPLASMEEVLLPLYLHHRYQVEAAASVLGGQHYVYAMRGDGRVPFTRATAAEQQAALRALMETVTPSALALPENIIKRMPPRPDGYDMTRELFPRYTGMASTSSRRRLSPPLTPSPASSSLSAPRASWNSTPSIRRCRDSTRLSARSVPRWSRRCRPVPTRLRSRGRSSASRPKR